MREVLVGEDFAVAGAALTVVYPFVKRYVSIPQFVLGAAFGWAVPMAFAAQTGEASQLGWLVFGCALIWATIYDTLGIPLDTHYEDSSGRPVVAAYYSY